MKKVYRIAFAAVLLVLGVIVTGRFLWENWYNPYHSGKRVREWADIAILDSDPIKRSAAATTLVEAFRSMGSGEPRIQLVMKFCWTRYNSRGEPEELPREVLPFLLEALHAPEMPPGSYQSIALAQVEREAALPALLRVINEDEDAHAREGAQIALNIRKR